jgi:hypothetical protein
VVAFGVCVLLDATKRLLSIAKELQVSLLSGAAPKVKSTSVWDRNSNNWRALNSFASVFALIAMRLTARFRPVRRLLCVILLKLTEYIFCDVPSRQKSLEERHDKHESAVSESSEYLK